MGRTTAESSAAAAAIFVPHFVRCSQLTSSPLQSSSSSSKGSRRVLRKRPRCQPATGTSRPHLISLRIPEQVNDVPPPSPPSPPTAIIKGLLARCFFCRLYERHQIPVEWLVRSVGGVPDTHANPHQQCPPPDFISPPRFSLSFFFAPFFFRAERARGGASQRDTKRLEQKTRGKMERKKGVGSWASGILGFARRAIHSLYGVVFCKLPSDAKRPGPQPWNVRGARTLLVDS